VIGVTVTFSEAVAVTGTPQLTLATGGPGTAVNYISGSGTATLLFNYTVGSNQSASPLEVASTGALALNGGTIRDIAGNTASITLPNLGSGSSLSGQKAIIIDTLAPTVAYTSISPSNFATIQNPTVTFSLSENATVTLHSESTCTSPISSSTVMTSGGGKTITTNNLPANAATTIFARAQDSFNNASCTNLVLFTNDNVAPLNVTFVRAAGQAATTNSVSVNFTATFNEAIDPTSFTGADISNTGTASAVSWTVAAVSTTQFTVSATSSGDGTLMPRIAASGVSDLAGNVNSSAITATQSVDYAASTFTVTINQAFGQADPVAAAPVSFTVVFSRAVGSSSFISGDLVQNGSASGITWSLSTTDNITWTVTATAISSAGTVIPSIPAGNVMDLYGNQNAASTSIDNTVTMDTTAPTLAFSSISPTSPNNSFTPTIRGTASETSTVTLYFEGTCTTPRSEAQSNAAFASPGITLTSNVGANTATTIFARAVDALGNASSCTSLVTYTHDNTAPAVTNVDSSLASGNYKAGQVIPVQLTFSKVVTVTGSPQITLATGGSNTIVNYASGSGTNTLTFNYTVFNGENSADLDYVATNSLALNGGAIRDSIGNNASLTLPAPGAAGSLGADKTIVVDTVNPTVSYTSVLPASPGTTQTPTLSINLSEAAQLVRLYSDGSCNTGISSPTGSGVAGANNITTSLLASGSTVNIRAQITDLAGNVSACTTMTTYVHDGTAPGVTSVTSSAANGTYKLGQSIPIDVVFGEVVFVTGTPRLTLSTGGGVSDAVINYVSGSGTTTLTFNYTVALGQTSADLNYVSTASLVPNGGTVRDLAGNNASLTLPATNAAGSLASQKAIVIDTAPPTLAYVSISPSSPGSSRTPTLTLTTTEAATVTLYKDVDGSCTTTISSPTAITTGAGQTITTLTLDANAVTSIYAKGATALGNTTACVSMVSYTHDNVAPSVTSFARSGGASTNSTPVNFALTFSEPINPSSLTTSDFTNQGTATGVNWSVTNIDGQNFTIGAISSGAGTIQPRLVAGAVADPAGNVSAGLVDSSNSVNYSPAALSVTVNQKVGQGDPVSSTPIDFTVVFSAAVDPATFTTADILTTGSTASGFTWTLTTTDNITWNLRASTVTNAGTVIPSIAANTVTDTFGNSNAASTSSDNIVTLDRTAPTLSYSSISPATPGTSLMPTVFGTTSEPSTVTLYFDSGCSTPRSAATASTAFASPGITVNSNVNANAATTIYGRAVDAAGNVSAGCPSLVTYTNDNTAPSVVSVSSSTGNGNYRAGQSVSIQVTFSENVTVTGFPQLTLATGGSGTAVNYSSGSGTSVLTFTYTVGAGENSTDLDYINTSSLALNGGTIRDATGNNATLTLPGAGGSFSIAGQKAIVIDTVTPVVTYVSISHVSPNASTTPTITATLSEAVSNFTLHSNSGCSAAISGTTGGSAGSTTKITNALVANSTTTIFAQVTDAAGNISACTSMTTYVNDSVVPTVSSVTSTVANGAYKAGQTIPITVIFTKAVVVTGTPQLTLATGGGGNNAVVNYSSGSGTPVLTFNYTVASGQDAADLDYPLTTSLSPNSGTIRDSAGNNANLALPATGGAGSIGGQKNIVIDTTTPTIATITSTNGNYPAGTVIDIDVNFSEAVTHIGSSSSLTLTNSYVANYQSKPDADTIRYRYTVAAGHTAADLNVTAFNIGTDTIRDVAATDASLTLPASNNLANLHNVIVDTTLPTVALTSSTSAHTSGTMAMTATFSESVTGFVVGDISVTNGSAGSFSGSGSVYTFTITAASAGTVSISLGASIASDAAGNNNTASNVMNFTFSSSAASYYNSWGANTNSQQGDGLFNATSTAPAQVGSDTDWSVISSGNNHSFGIRGGRLFAWGNNTSSKLGDGTSSQVTTPKQIGTFTDWTAISVGQTHTLGIRNGELYSWGSRANGRLGDGNTSGTTTTPVRVGSDTGWTMVAAGFGHSLGIRNGMLFAWGRASEGQLGTGLTTQMTSPQRIGTDSDWTYIAAPNSGHHSLGIRAGRLYAWGYNLYGMVGNGTTVNQLSPALIGSDTDWSMVSAGTNHSAGIRGGRLFTWGFNSNGQLGIGSTTQQNAPVPVGSDTTWTSVGTGATHTVAIKAGELHAFGLNSSGQLGDATLTQRASPVRIGTESTWSLVSGGGSHTLAVTQGKLNAWGLNSSNQLGLLLMNQRLIPAQIGINSNWSKISAGNSHSLGIRDGALYAWGFNGSGQIGDGSTVTRSTPVRIGTESDWTDISAGTNYSMGIRAGRLFAWGSNPYGNLGTGTSIVYSPTEVVGSHTTWTAVSASRDGYHTLGIRGGMLFAWGWNNNSQLGNGNTTQQNSPLQIGVETNWTKVAAGQYHSAGIAGGVMYGWGLNSSGQVGDNTTVTKTTPTAVVGTFGTWTDVVAGSSHSLGLLSGTLYGWGLNNSGQLGVTPLTTRAVPTVIGTFTNWTTMAAGSIHSLAIRGGQLYTWGNAGNGRLGNNSITPNLSTPTPIGSLTTWTAVAGGSVHSMGLNGSSAGEIVISYQPTAQTAMGGEATFSIAASSPQGELINYQWQVSTDSGVNWIDLAGEVGATLQLMDLTSAANNYMYRVVLTSSSMTVTSTGAILTVP
jgi:alpha-tubulin suppressor-like RCC1 family protein